MPNTLTIVDNRTGQSYEMPVTDGAVRATDLQKVRGTPDGAGLLSYDPAFMNTASTRSAITFIDGDRGLLWYRGYPIEQLAERSTFLEVAYLLLHGELPTAKALEAFTWQITHHTWVHENVKKFIDGFHHDAHPMSMLVSSVAALGSFYPDARINHDPGHRDLQIYRLIAKVPTLAAFTFRHSVGRPYVYPDNELGYAGNFLSMLFKMTEWRYKPEPALERALDVLFILHADHEQNCSTSTVRLVGSAHANLFASVSAGIHALSGPLHGGANEAVLQMLRHIQEEHGDVQAFVRRVKNREQGVRLMGFGHRVYKHYDPRAAIVKKAAREALDRMHRPDPMLDLAMELEEIALADDFFVSRKLYPNVDFYTGIIYKAMGFPTKMFTVLFALGRLPGWIAQWREMMADPTTKLGRPRQIYTGSAERAFVPIDQR